MKSKNKKEVPTTTIVHFDVLEELGWWRSDNPIAETQEDRMEEKTMLKKVIKPVTKSIKPPRERLS